MHEGCVPSPNQIVRGLDQPVYCGGRGRGEGRAPMAESLISLPTSRYLSALRSSPPPSPVIKKISYVKNVSDSLY